MGRPLTASIDSLNGAWRVNNLSTFQAEATNATVNSTIRMLSNALGNEIIRCIHPLNRALNSSIPPRVNTPVVFCDSPWNTDDIISDIEMIVKYLMYMSFRDSWRPHDVKGKALYGYSSTHPFNQKLLHY